MTAVLGVAWVVVFGLFISAIWLPMHWQLAATGVVVMIPVAVLTGVLVDKKHMSNW